MIESGKDGKMERMREKDKEIENENEKEKEKKTREKRMRERKAERDEEKDGQIDGEKELGRQRVRWELKRDRDRTAMYTSALDRVYNHLWSSALAPLP